MSVTASEREAQHRAARDADDQLRVLGELHRKSWAKAQASSPPARPLPPRPAVSAVPERPSAEQFARPLLNDIAVWRLGERRAARLVAEQQADEAHRRALERHEQAKAGHERAVAAHRDELERIKGEQAAELRLLARVHGRLADGDRLASGRAITGALGSLPYRARLVGWGDDGDALVAIDAPGLDAVPEREPTFTAGGKPSTRKRNQSERNDGLAELTAAAVIAAGRCGLAAAPGVGAVTAAAVSGGDVLAHNRVGRMVTSVGEDPIRALYELNGDLEQRGRTCQLAPVALDGRDDLSRLGRG